MNFLRAVAENLYSRYGNDISSLTMVFPSRRSQLFFFEELTGFIDRPVWSPEYQSLDRVVSSFTSLKSADDFSLLILLYEIYRKHTGSSETFDSFYFWGETLLNDFNDIDKYLVDTKLLFRNLKAQKNIEGDFSFLSKEQIDYLKQFWSSFDPAGESDLQGKFIEIWDVLPAIYNDFRQTLIAKNQAYPGMIYRDAAEKIKNGLCEQIDKRYVFVGFNALGECEAVLFSYLKRLEKADFYWDYDEYYINDKAMEAGTFLRKNLVNYPPPQGFSLQSEFAGDKNLHLIAAPSDSTQAKAIPLILNEMDADFDKKTAIVLANENLLIPVLYSLPDKCTDINITLGYPLAQTPVFTLAELLIRLQNSYREDNHGFYYKDVLAILRHGYLSPVAENAVPEKVKEIALNNRVYVNNSLFEQNPFLRKIFTPLSGYREIIDYLIDIFMDIAELPDFGNDEKPLRREYIYFINKSLNKLKKSIEDLGFEIGKSVFLSLIRNIFRELKIPFTGEPLKGLQIMGIHETRALDFENLIVLSVNEGRLPPDMNQLSYIPYNLRKAYGLPCFEHLEANAAYNFYRLIQRAKNIRLLYSVKSDGGTGGTGEMSRYLYQLKFESGLKIREYPVTFNISFGETLDIEVAKDEKTMQALMKYTGENAEKSLSPSALSSYLSCSLKFYFEKIVKLRQDETVSEELPLNILGNIIHRVMEELYLPFKGKTVSAAELSEIDFKSVETLIDKYFAREFYNKEVLPKDFSENGKLLLVRDVIRKYVSGILSYDRTLDAFTPQGFEEQVKMSLNIGNLNVSLAGIIDRIDKAGNNIRIIDYKTGAGRNFNNRMKFSGVASLFDANPDKRNKEAFQTFLYSLIYKADKQSSENITPALYFVRDCHSASFNHLLIDVENIDAPITVETFEPYEAEFKELLKQYLRELFNAEIPFRQTEYKKICQICSFQGICRKG